MEKKTKGEASTRQKVRAHRQLAKEKAFGPAPTDPADLGTDLSGEAEGQDRTPWGRGPEENRARGLLPEQRERDLGSALSEALDRVGREAAAEHRETPSIVGFVMGLALYQPKRPMAGEVRAWATKTAITSPSINKADRRLAGAMLEALATGEALKSPYAAIYEQLAASINGDDEAKLAAAPPAPRAPPGLLEATEHFLGVVRKEWHAGRLSISGANMPDAPPAEPEPTLGKCDLCKDDAVYRGSDGVGEKKVRFAGCFAHYEEAEAIAKKRSLA